MSRYAKIFKFWVGQRLGPLKILKSQAKQYQTVSHSCDVLKHFPIPPATCLIWKYGSPLSLGPGGCTDTGCLGNWQRRQRSGRSPCWPISVLGANPTSGAWLQNCHVTELSDVCVLLSMNSIQTRNMMWAKEICRHAKIILKDHISYCQWVVQALSLWSPAQVLK